MQAPVPSADSVGTIPAQWHSVYDYGVSPDDITAFVKAYNFYAERFAKEGVCSKRLTT